MDPITPTPPGARELTRAALRIPFFLKVPASQVDASWLQILALVALSLAAPTIYAALHTEFGRFDFNHMPGTLFHLPVMLVAAVVLSYLVDGGSNVRPLLTASLLAFIPIDALTLAAWGTLVKAVHPARTANWAFYIGPLVWLSLAIARFAIGLSTSPAWRKAAAIVASLAFVALPLGGVYRERSVWSEDWSKKAERYKAEREKGLSAASEESFYRQPELLRKQLDGLKPNRKGVIDVYLVGVAGYGSQDVFMREVESVAKLFRERFDADGHIVSLINNPKTVLTYPMASRTSLDATLERLSQVMDRDEDILVLFLTSHGSDDHKFSLELAPLEFKPLTPASVREALDASGIRNRVVIVSACYAGGFVPKLQDDNTLVIAAAAADRNSFGCSNENEWTYFGKAYFDEALRSTGSFTRAFEAAAPVIEERERKQGFDPSKPVMAAGNAIKAKLAALERQGASPVQPAAAPDRPLASLDKAERYVAILFQPEIAEAYYAACKENMAMNDPDTTLRRAPETFGGLDHSSPQWPRLVAAWDRYAELSCRRMNDAKLYHDVYVRQVRATMSDAELDAALRLLESKEGRRWYELEKRMNLAQTAELAKLQGDITAPLFDEFIKERDRLFVEHARRK